MKEDIKKMFVNDICEDFKNILLNGLEEESNLLPYCSVCINFLYELKAKGLDVTMNYFSDNLRDIIYNEIKKYLAR